jgi:hypothetical protein
MEIPLYRKILPTALSFFVRGKRYFPEVTWSEKLWTHNVFRVYEQIFGRRVGIRCEAGTHIAVDGTTTRRNFTFEAYCADYETRIRSFFKELASIRVEAYQLAPVMRGLPSPYLFAIAFGAFTKLAPGTSPTNGTVTVSGSDTFLIDGAGFDKSSQVFTAVSYNSAALTLGIADGSVAGQGYYAFDIWYKASPSTGANSLSGTFTGGGTAFQYALQYTGVTDPGITGSVSGEDASGTTFTQDIVTSVANGWVCWFGSGNGSLPTGTNGVGSMRSTVPAADWCAADSNGTVGATTTTVGYTNSSGTKGGVSALGFGASATGTGHSFGLMGVGQ